MCSRRRRDRRCRSRKLHGPRAVFRHPIPHAAGPAATSAEDVRAQARARRASSAAGPTLRASGHAPARCGPQAVAPGPAIPCRNDVLTCPLTGATVLARGHAG